MNEKKPAKKYAFVFRHRQGPIGVFTHLDIYGFTPREAVDEVGLLSGEELKFFQSVYLKTPSLCFHRYPFDNISTIGILRLLWKNLKTYRYWPRLQWIIFKVKVKYRFMDKSNLKREYESKKKPYI